MVYVSTAKTNPAALTGHGGQPGITARRLRRRREEHEGDEREHQRHLSAKGAAREGASAARGLAGSLACLLLRRLHGYSWVGECGSD